MDEYCFAYLVAVAVGLGFALGLAMLAWFRFVTWLTGRCVEAGHKWFARRYGPRVALRASAAVMAATGASLAASGLWLLLK